MHLDPISFNVSTSTGFLLESPLEFLPNYFEAWRETGKSIIELFSENRFRNKIDQLPLLDVDRLVGHRQIRLAHLQLCTLVSGYIWCEGDQNVPKVLPKNLALPYYKLSEKLGVQPGIGLHVATVLCNYKSLDENSPLKSENMEMLYFKFIEDYGNDWFFLATAQVELDFASAVLPLKNALSAASIKDFRSLQQNLYQIQNVIENMEKSLSRMGERLNPDVFFNQFRPYLAGTVGGKFEKWGGIIMEGVSEKPFKLAGGSAAQAAPIQCLDALLQIEHQSKSKDFLLDMRNYMLRDHRRFIESIENQSRIREIVKANSMEHPQLKQAYDDCVNALVNFRNKHIQIVTKFILAPKSKQNFEQNRSYKSLDEMGTGGTGIMPFLKNVRDTTKDTI